MGTEKKVSITLGGSTMWLLMVGVLGYLYGGLDVAIAMVGIELVLYVGFLLSVIPVAGILIYALYAKYAIGKVLALAGLTPFWLTSIMYWTALALAVFVCLIVSAVMFFD